MIVVVEPFRESLEHAAFNSALLDTIAHAFPKTELTFIAPANHLVHVEQELGGWPAGIRHVGISVPSRHATFAQRLRGDFRTIALVNRFADDQDTSQLVFASVLPSILYAIALRKVSRRLRARVHAIMHGGLAELAHRPPRNPFSRLIGLRAAMPLAQAAGVGWIVLEHAIIKQLARIAPRIADRAAVLPHPVPLGFLDHGRSAEPALCRPLKVGFLGLGTPQKGLDNFLQLAHRFAEESPGMVDFRFIGRVHENFRDSAAPYLKYLDARPASAPLRRSDFVQALKQLHFSCFLFQGHHYDLTASGVLLDCIGLGIPILARPHPLIDELTARHGQIGLIAEPGQEFEVLKDFVTEPDAVAYAKWRENLADARESRTPEGLAQTVRDLLSE